LALEIGHIWGIVVGSRKVGPALARLGQDLRNARLRRNISVADLAVRAGSSASSVTRLEKGDPGVAIGTLADVLVVLGLVERLADLIDVRKDDLGLALSNEHLPKRGQSFTTKVRKQSVTSAATPDEKDVIDPDGAAF
jgi:transcriptional regulator with XRE-family HTH domain